jgi:predicted MFS family arabinose efflux permease
VFVLAIACLEPVLPALTTRFATGPHRGAAMGVFHMSQFLGSFFGGLVGGAFLTRSLGLPFSVLAGFAALWLLATRSLGRWSPESRGDFG